MVMKVHVDVVSAEESIFSGMAEAVFVPAEMGELGVLPRHTPLLTRLSPGLLRVVVAPDKEELFFVSSGYLEIQPHTVTVLADTVMRTEELDAAAASAAKMIKKEQAGGGRFSTELHLHLALLRALEQVKKKGKR